MKDDNIKIIDPTRGFMGNESQDWAIKGQGLQDKLEEIMGRMKLDKDSASPLLLAEYMAANNDVTLYMNGWSNYMKVLKEKADNVLRAANG